MTISALIVAAGEGSRMGGGLPKQFRSIAGKPLVRHAASALLGHAGVGPVSIIVSPGRVADAEASLAGLDVTILPLGGDTRAQSVRNGLDRVATPHVLVHDAARPFCPSPVIDRLLAALQSGDRAVVPVVGIADTLAAAGAMLGERIDREAVVRVQTPQGFDTALLRSAYASWTSPDAPTDEASVVRAHGVAVRTVEGDIMLDKLTSPADWARAEALHGANLVARSATGFDVHCFGGPGPLVIGGIEIPHDRGLAGHSDADVALHAITDALLGAFSLGDIGQHFPPSDRQWKGASSDHFLAHAAALARDVGGIVDHVDCTIICEAPKIGPYRGLMRSRIATILGLKEAQVSIKATTTERLGFTGRGEGIAAQAIVSARAPAP